MYELAIIGGGPGGYVAAERAGALGLSVILFEVEELGGVCLNHGCIPTKTMLYSAKILDQSKSAGKYGVNLENPTVDFSQVMSRKNKVKRKLIAGVGAKMKAHKVEVVKDHAVISKAESENITVVAGGKEYQAKNLMISTGSSPIIPPIPGLDTNQIMTSTEILALKEMPSSLVVIGAGVIGIEFASVFSSFGIQVTVIELKDRILDGLDSGQAKMLQKQLEAKGVSFNLGAKVTQFEGKKVTFEKEGELHTIEGGEVLMSVGRKPNVTGVGLEEIGVKLNQLGGIEVDAQMKTNIPNIYAAGDVTGEYLLAHVASREGEVIVNQLAGRSDYMRYNAIPSVVYTNPEVSGVGLTEEQAKAQGIAVKVAKLPMAYAGRFVAENEGGSGECKVIVGEKYGEVLGVHMIGNPSSEMIYGAATAIESELTLKEMEEVIFPHPTVSEIFKETIFSFPQK